MQFMRRYWIAGLVLLLVFIHAIIIGYVRAEAAKLKSVSSGEVPLGLFYVQSEDRQHLTQLRILLAVPLEFRLSAKATVEHNRWTVHEAIEQALRQIDKSLLRDSSLLKVKELVEQTVEKILDEEVVDDVIVCERIDWPVNQFCLRAPQSLTVPSESLEPLDAVTKPTHARKQRLTASEQTETPENSAATEAESTDASEGDSQEPAST